MDRVLPQQKRYKESKHNQSSDTVSRESSSPKVHYDFRAKPQLIRTDLTWQHSKEGNLAVTPCTLFAGEGMLRTVSFHTGQSRQCHDKKKR